MTWLLGLGGLLKSGFSAALGWIGRYPWQFACLALLLASLWLWHGRNEARQDLADFRLAQEQAADAQKRVNDAAQAHYTEKANVADTKHEDMVAEAFDATQRFINEHRVQPKGGTCEAPAPAADRDSGIPAEVPADSGVVVSDVDVHRCADATAYAVAAHDWAKSLKMPENLLPE